MNAKLFWIGSALCGAMFAIGCSSSTATDGGTTTGATGSVTGTTGQAWCGPLVSGPADAISVRTVNGIITVPAQAIAQVSPVGQCP